ncbi:NUDIX hydrolase [Fusobacterium sp.]|uniref:NUDIX hydrolase n=1 Tax=Fusobacterium sp. TaxID=68766 RepID=UPI000C70E703|nr:NUDIX hydrolase [Fusobacterium sp.]
MNVEDLKFLKVAIKKHPTTGMDLEFLIKQDAVAAMVINEKGDKTLLVKQYRPGVDKEVYEIPAGLIDPGEKAIDTLYRELAEETGYQPKDYNIICSSEQPLSVSPGYTQEKLYIYIVQLKNNSTTPQKLNLDEGEDLTNHWFKLSEVENMSQDMKTIFALYLYKDMKSIENS